MVLQAICYCLTAFQKLKVPRVISAQPFLLYTNLPPTRGVSETHPTGTPAKTASGWFISTALMPRPSLIGSLHSQTGPARGIPPFR